MTQESTCHASQEAHGGPDETDQRLRERMARIRHKILVLSGKGGVGKSTVAANLAVFLSAVGRRTGLLDIDLHGPSIPKLLGLEGHLLGPSPEGLLPVVLSEKLKVMSVGFLLGEDQDRPVIWRGPMKHKVIEQFLTDVLWGDLDYLVIDSPPGTGDEPLSIAQLLPGADGAVIVTTPQELALADVRKCVQFCHQVRLPVIGVIENMSGLACPHCGRVVAPFKTGGGETMAREMDVPFLGRIPLDPQITLDSDAGTPYVLRQPESDAARAFARVVERILESGSGDADETATLSPRATTGHDIGVDQ
jgi:ATP-binding protein involved in chromosome partitioning